MGLVGNDFLVFWGRRFIWRPVKVCWFDSWHLISWVPTLIMGSYQLSSGMGVGGGGRRGGVGWGGLTTFIYTRVPSTAMLWCVDVHLRTTIECYAVIRSCTLAYLLNATLLRCDLWGKQSRTIVAGPQQFDSTWRHLQRWRPQSLRQKVNSSVNTMRIHAVQMDILLLWGVCGIWECYSHGVSAFWSCFPRCLWLEVVQFNKCSCS